MNKFETISPKQFEVYKFIYEPEESLICDGAVRTGKSINMTVAFIMWAMEHFDGYNFGICGKTVQSTERNIITPITSLASMTQLYNMRYRSGENLLIIERGEVRNLFYVFGGRDKSSYQLIQGITLAGVLFDEVALMPRNFVEQALARAITVEGKKYWFNCNPESPSHWFYNEWVKRADKRDAKHLHFELEDNPALSTEQIEKTKTAYRGVFYDRYILGKWVRAEGLIYPMFSKENVFETIPQLTKPKYYVSVDYGTYNPFSAGLWVHSFADDISYRIREYYYNGREANKDGGQLKTDEEYADEIEKLTKGLIQRRITVIVDPSASSFIEVMRRRGFYVVKADNSIIDGIARVSTKLANRQLMIHSSCKATINEFGEYSWDDRKEEDTPIKENDHAMDEIRYFVNEITQGALSW